MRLRARLPIALAATALACGALGDGRAQAWPLKPFAPKATASPSPTPQASPTTARAALVHAPPTPTPLPTIPDLYVRGNLLAIAQGYLFFTSGNAVRLGASVAVPPGIALGRSIRVTLDQTTRLAKSIELAAQNQGANEIDAAQLPSQYAALVPGPAATSAAGPSGGALGAGPVTVQFNVTVPGNTPPNDDIFIATDRSNFSPSEIRMQRSDPQHWTASLTVPGGTAVHYEYTRGTYATVERDRFGGIIVPRGLPNGDGSRTSDAVARWADLN